MVSLTPPFNNASEISDKKIESMAKNTKFNKAKNRYEVTVNWNGRNITVWHQGNLKNMDANAAQQQMKSQLRKILTIADVYRIGRGGRTTHFSLKGQELTRTHRAEQGSQSSVVKGSPYKLFNSRATKKSSSIETLFRSKKDKIPDKIKQKKADLKTLEDEINQIHRTKGSEAIEYSRIPKKYQKTESLRQDIRHLELRRKLMEHTTALF